jgi:hypothetical protein
MYVSLCSAALLPNIFCCDKYLRSYTRHLCINASRYTCRVSVIIVRFSLKLECVGRYKQNIRMQHFMKMRSVILNLLLAERRVDRYGEAKWRTVPAFRVELFKKAFLYMSSLTYFTTWPIRPTHVFLLYEHYVVHYSLCELAVLQPASDQTISTSTKIKSINNLSALWHLNHMKTGVEPTPGTSYYDQNLWFTLYIILKILHVKCNTWHNIL